MEELTFRIKRKDGSQLGFFETKADREPTLVGIIRAIEAKVALDSTDDEVFIAELEKWDIVKVKMATVDLLEI